MILGFLYTFALIAYAGGEVDAIEFSTYENIWTLINALQTVAYAVLISVMFSTFIIKEYAGKLNLLLFTYPVDKLNNPVPVSLLSGDRKPQIRFLGNHPSGSGNLYHKSFRM